MYRKKLLRRKLRMAAAILTVIAVVLTLTLFFLGGQHSVDDSVEAHATEEKIYGTVALNEVEAPQFSADFCTLTAGEKQFSIQWGDGNGCVMWYESGYPGFNMPIVVEGYGFTGGKTVTVQTGYGEFVYRKTGCGFAFREGHVLIDLTTEESVVCFGRSQEVLYLYDSDTLMYTVYSKEGGTNIVP